MVGIKRKNRSFGPIGVITDGKVSVVCQHERLFCTFRVADYCGHQKRSTDKSFDTPEWCEMRDDVLQEAARMLSGKKDDDNCATQGEG